MMASANKSPPFPLPRPMQEVYKKAAILIEALPYFKSFDEKLVVVKLGGSAMDESTVLKETLLDIVFMEQVGIRPVVVHGGGPHISSKIKEAGVSPVFVDGLRVTDQATLEVVDRVLSDINASIVKDIESLGGRATGLSGARDQVFQARKMSLPGKPQVDLGFVGEITKVNPERVRRIAESGCIPVLSPLGMGSGGQLFNINGDTAATRLAGALQAEKLVFLSNIAGILRNQEDPESLFTTLHPDQVRKLIESKVITGGMLPKVEASLSAMKEGVRKVHVIDGRKPHSLLLEIFTTQGVGTQFVENGNGA